METHYYECWRAAKHHPCAVAILERVAETLERIKKHAAQGQADPRLAKDQCWEIEVAAKEALNRIGIETVTQPRR